MRVEQKKRSEAINMLRTFSSFRQQYLGVHNDGDFPNNRLIFCAPELAFPLLHGLLESWNINPDFHNEFGRVSVYPVSRMSLPVHDSIFNFWEMWDTGRPAIGKSLIGGRGSFYFEINEDYNLNLKLTLHADMLRDELRDQVRQRLTNVKWSRGIQGRCRDYKQGTFVLFEWDFGLLKSLDDYKVAGERLSLILQNTIDALA